LLREGRNRGDIDTALHWGGEGGVGTNVGGMESAATSLFSGQL